MCSGDYLKSVRCEKAQLLTGLWLKVLFLLENTIYSKTLFKRKRDLIESVINSKTGW